MQVSILCSHVHHAKQLRDIFKQWSTLCYVYTDFDEFWERSQKSLSDLYLLDVKMVCGRERGLLDHPQYQTGQMNVAFYYSKGSHPLMSSSYRIKSLGDFNIDDPALPQQLSQLWNFLKAQRDRESEMGKLKMQLYETRGQLERTVGQIQQLSQQSDYRKLLAQFAHQIDQQCRRQDFLPALAKVVEQFDFIDQYALLELSPNGQKLLSPRLRGSKYRAFPSLWLGREHGVEGIGTYAQGLAHEVAVEYLGSEVMAIGPKLRSDAHPQFLLYLKVDTDTRQHLDWNLLQLLLNGFYGRSLLRESERAHKSSHFLSQWEFYDLLVEEGAREESPSRILLLEFHQLVSAVIGKGKNDFQWGRFYQEFTTLLDERIKHDYWATSIGRWGMAFLVSAQNYDQLKSLLQGFSKDFAYWRFFGDPDDILALNLSPKMRSISARCKEFFEHMAWGDREDANHHAPEDQKRLQGEEQTLTELAKILSGRTLEV